MIKYISFLIIISTLWIPKLVFSQQDTTNLISINERSLLIANRFREDLQLDEKQFKLVHQLVKDRIIFLRSSSNNTLSASTNKQATRSRLQEILSKEQYDLLLRNKEHIEAQKNKWRSENDNKPIPEKKDDIEFDF